MSDKPRTRRPICENRRARHEFEILDTLEAGMELVGSEVKSLRAGRANLTDAYVRFEKGEAFLVDAHISPYAQAGPFNHDPRRVRRLLISAAERERWARKVAEKGLTVVALRMYFQGPWAKVEVALARGKKLYDKRASMKEDDDRREMDRAMRRH